MSDASRRVVVVSRSGGDPDVGALERHAAALAANKRLPAYYPVGAHKAYAKFQEFYGVDEGRRIFVQRAIERGRGETIREKVADVFKTGAVVDDRVRLDARVSVEGERASVSVTRPSAAPRVTILSKRH